MTCVFAGNFAEVGCFRGKKAAAGPIGNDNKKAHAPADSSAALRNDNKKNRQPRRNDNKKTGNRGGMTTKKQATAEERTTADP